MKKIMAIIAALSLALAALLLSGCASGGHSLCYGGKCVHWTNAPAAK